MEDIKSLSSVTIGELTRIVREFEEKIQNGTEDPDRFLTIYEIEDLWSRFIGDTNVLYFRYASNAYSKHRRKGVDT